MITDQIGQTLSLLLMAVLLCVWLGLIVRRQKRLGPAKTLQNMSWFSGIFQRGWGIVRRSPWILWIPLLAVTLWAAEMRFRFFMYLSENPDSNLQMDFGAHATWSLLFSLYQRLPAEFIEAAGALTSRMFSGLSSGIVMTLLFLFQGAVILGYRKKSKTGVLEGKKGMLVGIISMVAGIFCLIFFFIISKAEKIGLLLTPFFSLAWILASAIAYSIFLEGMDMAAEGKKRSFVSATIRGIGYLKPLVLFFLVSGALTWVTFFPFLLPIVSNSKTGPVFGVPYNVAFNLQQILAMMISFVPLLAVIQKKSFLSAFDSCISLWAVHWKNLIAFVIICASLLLIPYLLTAPAGAFFLPFSWGKSILDLLEALFKTVLGVLVLCSTLVLLKELRE